MVNENSAELAPEKAGGVSVKVPVPVFSIVKVFVTGIPIMAGPKSVLSVATGVMSPSTIEVAFPRILISGAT